MIVPKESDLKFVEERMYSITGWKGEKETQKEKSKGTVVEEYSSQGPVLAWV
jgi:hypothetical protein